VKTKDEFGRVFLGVASIDDLLRGLAAAQPALRSARLEVEEGLVAGAPLPPVARPAGASSPDLPAPRADIDEWWEKAKTGQVYADPLTIAKDFLEKLQWLQPADADGPGEGWLRLPSTDARPLSLWEHATWVRSRDLSQGALRTAVNPDSAVVSIRTWPADQRALAVAAEPGRFVALLSPSRRFENLIGRQSSRRGTGRCPPGEAARVRRRVLFLGRDRYVIRPRPQRSNRTGPAFESNSAHAATKKQPPVKARSRL
jgi:hypothetical protein